MTATPDPKIVRKVQIGIVVVTVLVIVIATAVMLQPTPKQIALDKLQKDTDALQKQLNDGTISVEDANAQYAQLEKRFEEIKAMP